MRFLEVERLVSELINGQLEEMMNGRPRPQQTKTIPHHSFTITIYQSRGLNIVGLPGGHIATVERLKGHF